MAEQSDAAKRAAARKAKIQARGNAGLQRLAQTARGEEADMLYGESSAASSSTSKASEPTAQTTSATSSTPSRAVPAWTPPPMGADQAMPDQQQMAAQIEAMMSMFNPGGAGAAGGAPDMASMFASLMGGDPGRATPQNLLGDLDDPAGLGGAPGMGGGGMPPGQNPFAALASLGGMPGMAPPAAKSRVERFFPLVHACAVFALLAFVAAWWEPSLRRAFGLAALSPGLWDRWASLSGRRSAWATIKADVGGLQSLPLFWSFVTLEIVLLSTRFTILRSPPAPHSLLSNFLPLMPPKLARTLLTGSRYLSFASQFYKDGCLLVWGVGMLVALAEFVK